MKRLIIYTCLLIAGLLIWNSCERDQITAFPRGYSAINFTQDSVSYSFLGNQTGVHVEKINVRIIGDSASYDRHFNVKVLKDSLTTAQKSGYKILDGVVKAGQFRGTLSIKLFNSQRLKDTVAVLHLRIAKSKDFTIGNVDTVKDGVTYTSELMLYWTDKVIVPTWGYWLTKYFCQYPSTTAWKAIVIATGHKDIGWDLFYDTSSDFLKALGVEFGDYVRHYNATHKKPLTHADGPAKGQPVNPVF